MSIAGNDLRKRAEHMPKPLLPSTFAELESSPWGGTDLRHRSVRREIRTNLLAALETGAPLFPGIHGYDDTIVPQIVSSSFDFRLVGQKELLSKIGQSLPNTPVTIIGYFQQRYLHVLAEFFFFIIKSLPQQINLYGNNAYKRHRAGSHNRFYFIHLHFTMLLQFYFC